MANVHLDQPGAVPPWDLSDRLVKSLKFGRVKPGEMAQYLGVSPAGLRNWTSGKVHPKTSILRLWALRTGVDYGWLLTGAPPPDDAVMLRYRFAAVGNSPSVPSVQTAA